MDLETLKRFDVDGEYPFSPWTHDGYSYASDNRILVRCPALPDLPEDKQEAPRESAEMLFEEHYPAGAWYPAPDLPALVEAAPCPNCGGKTVPVCAECDGTGEVTFVYATHDGRVYYYEADCPVCDGLTGPCRLCDGTGRDNRNDAEREGVRVAGLGVLLQLRYLRLIASLPNAQLSPTGVNGSVIAFRADGGVEGLLMAMREG